MSNNLNVDQMVEGQDQKETTHNDANGQLDAALTEIVDVAVDDTNAKTLTDSEFRRQYRISLIDDSPVPTGAVTITVPAIKRGLFIIDNGLSFDATVEISGQSATSPVVASMTSALLECNGSDVRQLVSSTAGSSDTFLSLSDTPSSFASGDANKGVRVNSGETALEFYTRNIDLFSPHFAGAPGSSALVSRFVASRAFEIPINLVGSQGHAGVAATAQTDFDLQLNAVSIGTIRFAASGTVATFIKASASTVAAGDRIDIVAPGSADVTLADLTFTIVGDYV